MSVARPSMVQLATPLAIAAGVAGGAWALHGRAQPASRAAAPQLRRFVGRTSEGQPIRLTLRNGRVVAFHTHFTMPCSDGTRGLEDWKMGAAQQRSFVQRGRRFKAVERWRVAGQPADGPGSKELRLTAWLTAGAARGTIAATSSMEGGGRCATEPLRFAARAAKP